MVNSELSENKQQLLSVTGIAFIKLEEEYNYEFDLAYKIVDPRIENDDNLGTKVGI